VTHSVEIVGDGLGVQIIGGRDIVVSSPEDGLSVTYRKDGLVPCSSLLMALIAHRDPSKVKFWAQAWKAAYQKARSLGWLGS
jgi:hypothetical protein